MCTAVSWNGYFGRTLDLEHHYREGVTVTPRRSPLKFRMAETMERHYAIVGVAHVEAGYPLYYDGVNEKGLAMAGLNFPESACYQPPAAAKDNIAPFELIPWVLGQCTTAAEAKLRLEQVNLTKDSFSEELPLTPLHWMVTDGTETIVVEPVEDGLHIYDAVPAVLTNEPPFPWQVTHLSGFLNLTANPPESRFSPELKLTPHSRGMGAAGLPGDWSSPSRFVRAAFLRENSLSGQTERENVSQFFHILSGVAQVKGCTRLGDGKSVVTVYTSGYNCRQGICYYTTCENSQLSAVDMGRENLDGRELSFYPLLREEQIRWVNL